MPEEKSEGTIETPTYFVDRYVSHVEITATYADFLFTFGRHTHMTKSQVVSESHTRLTMSPQFAKFLLTLLQSHVRKYEEKVGVIAEFPESEKNDG